MRKKRDFVQGAFYHVTSRTNDKIRVFENKLGQKIMLITLQDAKEKYRFRLANFCVMPTHIHLLMQPEDGSNLSTIMQWIKTHSAKRWNCIHGSSDHLWGHRFFARAVKDPQEYEFVMNYIDQNPVKAGLALSPAEWKASGAYYKAWDIQGLVDFAPDDRQPYIKLLSPIPPVVSRILPPAQLSQILQYYGAYAEAIEKLYALVSTIPGLGETETVQNPPACLRYSTGTVDYFVCEYDGQNTMFGKVRSCIHPSETKYQKFSLSTLKKNPSMRLDFSFV
ncbi:MAG: transposase [Treponema sp.]|jgi:putative transposase|nr:transposase [Treponema sp.]